MAEQETFNPWTVVNLVFHHLADHGLHPVLGDAGDPAVPAAALLRAMGIEPGRNDETSRIHGIARAWNPRSGADGHDAAATDADGARGVESGLRIDDASADDDEIERRRSLRVRRGAGSKRQPERK